MIGFYYVGSEKNNTFWEVNTSEMLRIIEWRLFGDTSILHPGRSVGVVLGIGLH